MSKESGLRKHTRTSQGDIQFLPRDRVVGMTLQAIVLYIFISIGLVCLIGCGSDSSTPSKNLIRFENNFTEQVEVVMTDCDQHFTMSPYTVHTVECGLPGTAPETGFTAQIIWQVYLEADIQSQTISVYPGQTVTISNVNQSLVIKVHD
jgi:hypothetical protein